MQTFENDTNWAKNAIKSLPCSIFTDVWSFINIVTEFAQNILLWHAYQLTDACATRSFFAGRVHYLLAGRALTHTVFAHTVWFLEQATRYTRVDVTWSNSTDLNLMAYIISCGITTAVSTGCMFKMLMKWRSVCWCLVRMNEWMNEWMTKIYIARLKAYKYMLNFPRLTEY